MGLLMDMEQIHLPLAYLGAQEVLYETFGDRDGDQDTYKRAIDTAISLAQAIQGSNFSKVATIAERLELADAIAEETKASILAGGMVKRGERPYSRPLHELGAIGQLWKSRSGIPNLPGPISSMVVLGALGAGGGNLAGRFLGRAVDDEDQRAEIRRKTMRTGALMGLLPGLALGTLNYATGANPLVGSVIDNKKIAYDSGILPMIQVDRAESQIWNNPQISNSLPLHVQAQTAGLLRAAQNLPDKNRSNLVTPMDVTRAAIGMGSGYLSGQIVGKTLGFLFGLPPKAQDRLAQAGMTAGFLKSVVPMAYAGMGN